MWFKGIILCTYICGWHKLVCLFFLHYCILLNVFGVHFDVLNIFEVVPNGSFGDFTSNLRTSLRVAICYGWTIDEIRISIERCQIQKSSAYLTIHRHTKTKLLKLVDDGLFKLWKAISIKSTIFNVMLFYHNVYPLYTLVIYTFDINGVHYSAYCSPQLSNVSRPAKLSS